MIRKAKQDDLNRIAKIEVFNYRLKFYPIFLDAVSSISRSSSPRRCPTGALIITPPKRPSTTKAPPRSTSPLAPMPRPMSSSVTGA